MLKNLRGRAVEIGAPKVAADAAAAAGGVPFHIVAIMNPLTRQAQRISQVRGAGRGGVGRGGVRERWGGTWGRGAGL